MEKDNTENIVKASWKKFIAISSRGEFLFSRGLFREDGLDSSTHCYLAYSSSERAILFCFTRGLVAAGAFRLKNQKPKGSLLTAPAFFEHFRLKLSDWVGTHPVTKASLDGIAWHMIQLATPL